MKDNRGEIITLVGMSNSGKSTEAKKLADTGFRRLSVDSGIKEEMGFDNMEEFANWLGRPCDVDYPVRARRLLVEEALFCNQNLHQSLLNLRSKISSVIDTPGSFCYMPDHLIDRLIRNTTIIYLVPNLANLDGILTTFKSTPKPLIWKADSFGTDENILSCTQEEYEDDSFLRAKLLELIEFRHQIYQNMAHITVSAEDLFSGKLSLLEILKEQGVNI
jgi:ABC-type dipeptide/oligopeptide/nickel transport system ATPase component